MIYPGLVEEHENTASLFFPLNKTHIFSTDDTERLGREICSLDAKR
jgi:hypothetical protein